MFQLQFIFCSIVTNEDRFVAPPRHNFVTGATLLQLAQTGSDCIRFNELKVENATFAEYSCPIRLRGAR